MTDATMTDDSIDHEKTTPQKAAPERSILDEMLDQQLERYGEWCQFVGSVERKELNNKEIAAKLIEFRRDSVLLEIDVTVETLEQAVANLRSRRQAYSQSSQQLIGYDSESSYRDEANRLGREIQEFVRPREERIQQCQTLIADIQQFNNMRAMIPASMRDSCPSPLLRRLSVELAQKARAADFEAKQLVSKVDRMRDSVATAEHVAQVNKVNGFDVSEEEFHLERLRRDATKLEQQATELNAQSAALAAKRNRIEQMKTSVESV